MHSQRDMSITGFSTNTLTTCMMLWTIFRNRNARREQTPPYQQICHYFHSFFFYVVQSPARLETFFVFFNVRRLHDVRAGDCWERTIVIETRARAVQKWSRCIPCCVVNNLYRALRFLVNDDKLFLNPEIPTQCCQTLVLTFGNNTWVRVQI